MNHFRSRTLIWGVWLSFVTTALSIHSTRLQANTATLGDYDSICGAYLQMSDQNQTSTSLAQRISYCQSAKSAKDSAETSGLLWKLWISVAGLCTLVCLTSFRFGVEGSLASIASNACTVSNAAAGVTDAVITRQYMNALMNIGTAAATRMMANQSSNTASAAKDSDTENAEAENTQNKTSKEKNWGACLQAAVATYTSYQHYSSVGSSESSELSSLQSASGVIVHGTSSNTAPTNAGSSTNAGASNTGGNTQVSTSTTVSGSSDGSASCATSAHTVGLMLQCATASDSTLPSGLSSHQFPNDFQKQSGQNLGDFMAQAKTPSSAMASALSTSKIPGLTSEAVEKTLNALAMMESSMMVATLPTDSTYSSSRGGGSGSSHEEGDLGSVFGNLMQQMNPKNKDGNDPNAGLKMVIFANQQGSPAQLAENRSLGLFDRMTYRYHFVALRTIQTPVTHESRQPSQAQSPPSMATP